jgi:Type III restriction enzyme, res subunit
MEATKYRNLPVDLYIDDTDEGQDAVANMASSSVGQYNTNSKNATKGGITRKTRDAYANQCREYGQVLSSDYVALDGALRFDPMVHCVDAVLPDLEEKDRNSVYYSNVYHADHCKSVGGSWYSDPKGDNDGIDVCLISGEDKRCMETKDADKCFKVPESSLAGLVSGRHIGNKHREAMRAALMGEIPDDWPDAYDVDDDRTAINRVIKSYFDEKFFTRPFPSTVPVTGPRSDADKQKACERRADDSAPLSMEQLSTPQAVVYTVFKATQRMLKSKGGPRGIMAWHSTGSGKTVIATGAVVAFWDARSPSNPMRLRPIIFLSTQVSIEANPPSTFAAYARRFYRRDWLQEVKDARSDDHAKRIKEDQGKRMARVFKAGHAYDWSPMNTSGRMLVMTFAQFADVLSGEPGFARDALVIVDEVHALLKAEKDENAKNARIVQWLLSRDPDVARDQHGDLKLLLLTATPGDSPGDMVQLLRMVQNREKPDIMLPSVDVKGSLARFQRDIHGLVSYVDLSNDQSRFPVVNRAMVPSVLGDNHTEVYVKRYWELLEAIFKLNLELAGRESIVISLADFAKLNNIHGGGGTDGKNGAADSDKKNNKNKEGGHWMTAARSGRLGRAVERCLTCYNSLREASNLIFLHEGQDVSDEALLREHVSLEAYAPKVKKLLDKVSKSDKGDKHFVYTAFGGDHKDMGLVSTMKVELKKLGYVQVTSGAATQFLLAEEQHQTLEHLCKLCRENDASPDYDSRCKTAGRFFVVLGDEPEIKYATETLTKLFNHRLRLVTVCIASGSYYESLDLNATRHIHIMEPMASMVKEQQLIGRAQRMCSHSALPYDQWVVTVHSYMTQLDPQLAYEKLSNYRKSKANLIASLYDGGLKVRLSDGFKNAIIKSLEADFAADYDTTIDDVADTAKNQAFMYFGMVQRLVKEQAVDCRVLKDFNKVEKCGRDAISEEAKISRISERQKTADFENREKRDLVNKEKRDLLNPNKERQMWEQKRIHDQAKLKEQQRKFRERLRDLENLKDLETNKPLTVADLKTLLMDKEFRRIIESLRQKRSRGETVSQRTLAGVVRYMMSKIAKNKKKDKTNNNAK